MASLANVEAGLLGSALKSQMKGGNSAQSFLFCIPVQVGPASAYARNVKHWFHFILIIQVVVCFLRFVMLSDLLGGFWMTLLCALGWYAYKEDMNITYICLWGLGCFVNGIFDILSIVLPVALNLITLDLLGVFIRACVPASELLGAAYAWHLYLDYYSSGGGVGADKGPMAGFVAGMPDPMGKLVDEVDPEEVNSLMKGAVKVGQNFQSSLESEKMVKQMQQGVEQLTGQSPPPSPHPQPTRSQKQAPCC